MLAQHFIDLFIASAPWLLLGLVVAGLMKVLVPQALLAKHLGRAGWLSAVKAALLGAPLPLCSCGVIPAAMGLRRNGASKGATTAFLISTPETGVDSIAISYALLGPFMAVVRPIAALTTAIVAGVWVGSKEHHSTDGVDVEAASASSAGCCHEKPAVETACCASETHASLKSANETTCDNGASPSLVSSCCGNRESTDNNRMLRNLADGIRFSLVDLVKDISLWLLIGLFFAALMKTYVPNEFLAAWGSGLSAFVVMALIGVPMYICATASTPIAAGLLFSGVSPGAVLVFMLVGPATNIATVGLVKRELGYRVLSIYLLSVVGVGFVFGYITNIAFEHFAITLADSAGHHHSMALSTEQLIAALVLALLIANTLVIRIRSRLFSYGGQ